MKSKLLKRSEDHFFNLALRPFRPLSSPESCSKTCTNETFCGKRIWLGRTCNLVDSNSSHLSNRLRSAQDSNRNRPMRTCNKCYRRGICPSLRDRSSSIYEQLRSCWGNERSWSAWRTSRLTSCIRNHGDSNACRPRSKLLLDADNIRVCPMVTCSRLSYLDIPLFLLDILRSVSLEKQSPKKIKRVDSVIICLSWTQWNEREWWRCKMTSLIYSYLGQKPANHG